MPAPRPADRARPIRFLVMFAAAVLLPAQAQHDHGGWHGGGGGQPGGGWHGMAGSQPLGTPGLQPQGTPGLHPQGTPGLEWHGTPGLRSTPEWHGTPGWHGGRAWGDDDWRGGHWDHGPHGGRNGWWWVVGPTWYFYPSPVYPYPAPFFVPYYAPAPLQYYLYCPSFAAYYPDVTACPDGWLQVPAIP